MDIGELEKNVLNVAKVDEFGTLRHKITMTGIPKSTLVRGAIPLLLLLTSYLNYILAYLFLPTSAAIFVILMLVLFNLYFVHRPVASVGLTSAFPLTLSQKRVFDSLQPFVKYSPPWWCIDGHWSTLLPLLLYKLPRSSNILVQEFLGCDGTRLTLEWGLPMISLGSVKGVIIAIPGLNGSSNGGYMVDLMMRMNRRGYAVVILSGRGAGHSQIESMESSFHLARSDDLLCALEAVETVLTGNTKVYMLGYSAGGVRALTFASVYGSLLKNRIAGILSFGGSVCNKQTHVFKSSAIAYQPVIMHAYLSTLQGKFISGGHNVKDLFVNNPISTFQEYDLYIGSQIHNLSVSEYHAKTFCKNDIHNIAVPTLIVNAIDDPVLHVDDAIVQTMALENSHITLFATAKGGHIGWPTGWDPKKHGYSWIANVALAYMDALMGQ